MIPIEDIKGILHYSHVAGFGLQPNSSHIAWVDILPLSSVCGSSATSVFCTLLALYNLWRLRRLCANSIDNTEPNFTDRKGTV